MPEDFSVKFQGEEGTDVGGLRKEWLQDVLESIVISKEAKEEEQGLDCIRGKHDCVNGPQYLLELLPSGTLIPIMSSTLIRQEQEPKEKEQGWTGWVRSKISEFMDYLKEPLLSPAQKRYRFLGKWIAKAYVVSGIGYSPYSFHPKIYERLLWGQEVTCLRWDPLYKLFGVTGRISVYFSPAFVFHQSTQSGDHTREVLQRGRHHPCM